MQGSLTASRGVKDCTWQPITRHLGKERHSVCDLEGRPEAFVTKKKSRQ